MFEHRLLEARKKKGLTQKQVAEQAEIHVASYSAYENNHKIPPVDILLRVANALDVSLDWLCGRANSEEVVNTYGAVARNLLKIAETFEATHYMRTGMAEKVHDDVVSYIEYTKIVIYDPELYKFFNKNAKFKELAGEEDREMYAGWLRDRLNQLDKMPINPVSEEVDEDLPF